MKKSLVLAMAMALGVTASAYAANPFSDVPAGHWAYDSIDKLAAAGVIDGMGDGTYQGDKTMTRYEMAQIVAKAMAKGANVDKLAAEFADELDNLGVRVANLEKKADNLKISGIIRADYWSFHGEQRYSDKPLKATNHRTRLRSDLNLTGTINEDWTYAAVIRNEQTFDNTAAGKGEENTRFKEANVNGRIGGLKVQAGRYAEDFEENSIIWSDTVDGIKVSYGKKIKVTAAMEQLAPNKEDEDGKADSKLYYGTVDTKVGVFGVHIADYAVKYSPDREAPRACKNDNTNIFVAKVSVPLIKNVSASATYMQASEDDKNGRDNSAIGTLNYSNRKVGLFAKYFDVAATCVIDNNHGLNASNTAVNGFFRDGNGAKGWVVGGSYAIAKNISATLEYDAWKDNKTGEKADTLFTRLQFKF